MRDGFPHAVAVGLGLLAAVLYNRRLGWLSVTIIQPTSAMGGGFLRSPRLFEFKIGPALRVDFIQTKAVMERWSPAAMHLGEVRNEMAIPGVRYCSRRPSWRKRDDLFTAA